MSDTHNTDEANRLESDDSYTYVYDLDWLAGLKNRKDALRISARVLRIEQNNFGDSKSDGDSVSELRFTFGPGYRVYYTLREGTVCILLGGGTLFHDDILGARLKRECE